METGGNRESGLLVDAGWRLTGSRFDGPIVLTTGKVTDWALKIKKPSRERRLNALNFGRIVHAARSIFGIAFGRKSRILLPFTMQIIDVSVGEKRTPSPESGFNRLELVLVMATVVLLAGVAFPTLGNTKTRSQRISCFANLRQIGHAIHVWGNDHGNRTPWRTGFSEGGTFFSTSPFKNAAWYQFASLSNELVTPEILVCPADKNVGAERVIATTWSASDPSGGYRTLGFRDLATSYTVALDAFFDQPRSILSSDRNVRDAGRNSACSAGVGDANFFIVGPSSPGQGWTNAIHFQGGNVLFYDGAVGQISSADFSNTLNAPYFSIPYWGSDNGDLHLLITN